MSGPDLGGAEGPGPQASHQQGVSHQTPQFLKPCNSIANPFLKSQIRHWAQASHQRPQASHQLNPASFMLMVNCKLSAYTAIKTLNLKYFGGHDFDL